MTRAEAREKIEAQLANPGPYSHNLISSYLGRVAKRYGASAANALIREFDLVSRGWHELPIKKEIR